MSVYKRCSRARFLDDGTPNPWFCLTSPRCEHHWHYYFRVNGRRYRASTETHDKRQAENIEPRERSRILDGRHGIRRQPDITFKESATIYLRDHADLHKKSAKRDREILKTLNRFFGSAILHEITSHRIEQFKRDRLNGTWRAFRQRRAANPVKPATVNREARHTEIDPVESRRMEVPCRFASQGSEEIQGPEPADADSLSG